MTTASLSATDLRTREDVLRQLDWDSEIDASAIGVSVKDGAVTLTGFIDSYPAKLAAERDAARVHGVRAVANDLQVRLMLERPDTDIAADAAAALRATHGIPATVQAMVHHGHIALTGVVERLFQKGAAERVVRRLHGVRGVANHITVAPGAVTRDVRHQIMKALHRDADVDARHIVVEVDGTKATLSGSVSSVRERKSAEFAAANTLGISEVANHLDIRHKERVEGADELC